MNETPEPTRAGFRLRGWHLWLLGLAALPAVWVWLDPYTIQIMAALQHSAAFKAALPIIKPLGKLGTQVGAIAVVGLLGLALRRRRVLTWLALTALCLLATGIVVNIPKLTVHRERPKYEYHLVATEGLAGDAAANRFRSFPSADTASVFAIATATAPFSALGAAVVAVVGCLVGLARIAVGMHHPADVWGAMVMATGASALVLQGWRRRMAARAAPDAEGEAEAS